MKKKAPPAHLVAQLGLGCDDEDNEEEFEAHLARLRRNPPDQMVIRSGDGKVMVYRMPKVRPGRRRLH